MEDNSNMLESLLEKAEDYGRTSYELVKLKALDKAADTVSSLVPDSLVFVLSASFILFLNLGLALWLGDILGKLFYGFFLVAAFYVLTGITVHFFMRNRIKKLAGNFFIKHMLK